MISFRKHDAMCRKRHFVTIMHPDHSRHSSSFTFQMGFLLFLCFLIETSSRRKKKPKRENILVKASPIANYFSVYCACGCKKGMCVQQRTSEAAEARFFFFARNIVCRMCVQATRRRERPPRPKTLLLYHYYNSSWGSVIYQSQKWVSLFGKKPMHSINSTSFCVINKAIKISVPLGKIPFPRPLFTNLRRNVEGISVRLSCIFIQFATELS